MVDRDFFVNGIFVYYKILKPGSLNTTSDCYSLDSCSNNQTTSSYIKDSVDSDFMCTVVQSRNSISVVDVLKFIGYPLDFSNYDVVFKVLVSLQDYFTDSVDLSYLDELTESYHRKCSKDINNLDRKDDSLNNLNKKHDSYDHNLFKKNKTLNMDFLKEKFDHLLGLGEKKKCHLVWVSVKLDEQLPSVDNNIYIKIYLLPKYTEYNVISEPCFSKTSQVKTTTTTITDTHTSKFKPETKSPDTLPDSTNKTKLDTSLTVSDREEINNIVNKWSLTNDGKLKDIRSLLSTLQNIVSNEVEWEPLPLTLLVENKNKLKTYYRKALLVFHPDKQKDKNPKTRLLFELITQTLMESWKDSS